MRYGISLHDRVVSPIGDKWLHHISYVSQPVARMNHLLPGSRSIVQQGAKMNVLNKEF
jgi:hypothetical protein